jgi:hypothetical protein
MKMEVGYIFSRKIKLSIDRCLSDIYEDRFNEQTVKELLIDLRELAIVFRNMKGGEPKYDSAIAQFIEICDFIAHANRDRGVIENNIRSRIEKIAYALDHGGDEQLSEVTKVKDFINSDAIVGAMLAMAFNYLVSFKQNLSKDDLIPAWERKNDIALCIISLLQDATIKLENKGGRAFLHVVSYEGHYRLYCSVFGSRVDQDAKTRTGGTGQIIIGFPVIVTYSPDIDGVLPEIISNWESLQKNIKPPPIIETFRGSDTLLHVRLIVDD